MYDTVEEARQKLEGSVVLFDKQPVYIVQCGGATNKVVVKFIPLPLSQTKELETKAEPIDNILWDFRTIGSKLGYVNTDQKLNGTQHTVFTSRIPTRHSRQGLDSRTVHVEELNIGVEWNNLIHSEGLRDTMLGKFPTLFQGFDLVTNKSEKFKSVAIGRKMKLVWDRVTPPVLFYRQDKVGYTENGVDIKLAAHKKFLAEELADIEGLRIA